MDLFELKRQIQNKSIYNFYVFGGEETGIMKIYINQLAKIKNLQIEYMDSVQSAYERIHKPALVVNYKLFVIQDDKSFLKAEKLWKVIPKAVKNNLLVLIYTKVDKRSKFFKQIDYVPFNSMPPEVLSKYIMKQINISESNARNLAEVCQCSYDRCLQECDKIKSFVGYRESIKDPITYDMAYRLLINEGTIYKPIGDITFNFVDAVMNRGPIATLEDLMDKVRAKKEPRLLLLSLLYKNFRNLFMCQCLGNNCSDYAKATGLSNFEINIARRRFNIYTTPELKRAMDIIQDLEYGVKTGTIDEQISIDYFIAQVI